MKFTCGSVMDDEHDVLVKLMSASHGVLGVAPLMAAHVPCATFAKFVRWQ